MSRYVMSSWMCIFDGFRQWKGINGMLKADVDRLMIDFDFDFKYWLRSPRQWSIRRRDGAERPTRLIAQLALESCYWSGFNSSWWKVIPIRYSFVQKGILSQRGVSSYVFKWFFMSTTSWYKHIYIYLYIFSSARVKRSLTGRAINPFKILYRLVSLKFFLLVCKSVQPRSWIRAVTLDLRW